MSTTIVKDWPCNFSLFWEQLCDLKMQSRALNFWYLQKKVAVHPQRREGCVIWKRIWVPFTQAKASFESGRAGCPRNAFYDWMTWSVSRTCWPVHWKCFPVIFCLNLPSLRFPLEAYVFCFSSVSISPLVLAAKAKMKTLLTWSFIYNSLILFPSCL